MLRGCAPAAACAAALVACSCAGAVITPSQAAVLLGKNLTTSMRAYYDKEADGPRITKVTCTLAANERTGHCTAHFTNPAKTILGVFQLRETIDVATQEISTKTLSTSCTIAATGKPVSC